MYAILGYPIWLFIDLDIYSRFQNKGSLRS